MPAGESRLRDKGESLDAFVRRCAACLAVVYPALLKSANSLSLEVVFSLSVRWVIRLAATLLAAECVPDDRLFAEPLRKAARAVLESAHDGATGHTTTYESAVRAALDTSRAGIFASNGLALDDEAFSSATGAFLGPGPDVPIEPILFQSMPVSWIGQAYQSLLAFHPDESGKLVASRTGRKRRGVYFTPPALVAYITESVLGPLLGSASVGSETVPMADKPAVAVLDPAMGGGDFLTGAIDYICDHVGAGHCDGGLRARVAATCVYGVDIDPVAVDIARFAVWVASRFADGICDDIRSHLICADSLGSHFDWTDAFPDAMRREPAGFDAVVGNPPYIAAKNGLGHPRSLKGQSDSYLLFLSAAIERGLVRRGGMLSMVLPDPMLVRGNAAKVRRTLVEDWELISVLHISGAFPEAVVANVVPVCRNAAPAGRTFTVSRIERAAEHRAFSLRPRATADILSRRVRRATILSQPRSELLYMLEDGAFAAVIRRIHGESASLSTCQPPFAPLRELNVKSVYRGEEVGKAAINHQKGDMPMLLGGQSIKPYEVTWEGRRTDISRVKKPLDRYKSTKILLQKSSARIVAALDEVRRAHPGYVFPQSVYGIELRPSGVHELYLLCILNSQVMNEYIRRTVTGYKMLQPQLELEDIRALPIRRVSFTTPPAEREADVAHAIRVFEDESLRSSAAAPFPELANLVVSFLAGCPEKSDVVHDLLVHLGRLVVDLTRAGRESPDADTTRRLEAARSAIETVVWRLYSSEPAQMALPF